MLRLFERLKSPETNKQQHQNPHPPSSTPSPAISPFPGGANPAIGEETKLKIVFLGSNSVGKTSLLFQYTHNCHSQQYYPTIGVEVVSKWLPGFLNSPRVLRLECWDVPWPEAFGPNVSRIAQSADAFALVFNAASPASVLAVDEWREVLQKTFRRFGSSFVPPPIALLVHKSDIKKALLTSANLDEHCKKNGYIFWRRTSVFDGQSVKEALDSLTKAAIAHHLEEESRIEQHRIEREKEASSKVRIDPLIVANAKAQRDLAHSNGGSPSPRSLPIQLQHQMQLKMNAERENLLRKAVELQGTVTDFYGRLQTDLARLKCQPLTVISNELKQTINELEEQRAEEQSHLISSTVSISSNLNQNQTQSAIEQLSKQLEHTQSELLEAVNKWRLLISQLFGEASLSPPNSNANFTQETNKLHRSSEEERGAAAEGEGGGGGGGRSNSSNECIISPETTPQICCANTLVTTSVSPSSVALVATLANVAASAPIRVISPGGTSIVSSLNGSSSSNNNNLGIGSSSRRMGFSFKKKSSPQIVLPNSSSNAPTAQEEKSQRQTPTPIRASPESDSPPISL